MRQRAHSLLLSLIACVGGVALPACSVAAEVAEEWCSRPTLVAQLDNDVAQKGLIASGLLNAEVGRATSEELLRAVSLLRAETATSNVSVPLHSEECARLVQAHHELVALTGLAEAVLTLTNRKRPLPIVQRKLRVLLPIALLRGKPIASSNGWFDADSENGRHFGFDAFVASIYHSTPLALYSASMAKHRLVNLLYHEVSTDEAIWEGIGDLRHGDGSIRRYFFNNRVYEYAGYNRGLFLKFAVEPPEDFTIPGFLGTALSRTAVTDVLKLRFATSDERRLAWLLIGYAVINISGAHFTSSNGWQDVRPHSVSGGNPCDVGPGISLRDAQSVRVIFATNRTRSATFDGATTNPVEPMFLAERDTQLHFGCAQIAIATEPVADGAAGSPAAVATVIDSSRPPTLVRAHYLAGELEDYASYVRLIDTHKTKDNSRALLFIHGYNTSFRWALDKAALVAAHANYAGKIYMFSWPSNELFYRYLADLDAADDAVNLMEAFIKSILHDRNVRTLDIVAHSMGSRQILAALEKLHGTFHRSAAVGDPVSVEEERRSQERLRLGQVVLAAPDVDPDVFRDKVTALAPFASRITVYVSRADSILRLRRLFLGGRSRAGTYSSGEDPVLGRSGHDTAGVHVIDASKPRWPLLSFILDNSYGHGDFSDDPEVRRDIGLVLAARNPIGLPTGRDSEKRGVRFCQVPYKSYPTESYWVMVRRGSAPALMSCPSALAAR